MPRTPRLTPSTLAEWPAPFDPRWELDWSRPDYSRRLLREHLDQTHDGATRRVPSVDQHVRRLRRLLPAPPARLLDAACGPGLYAVRLAGRGYDVSGVDVSPAALRHARGLAASTRLHGGAARFRRADLRALQPPRRPYDAAILIYYVLEAFPAREQPRVLRRLAATLRPGGRLIVEMRLQPDQPPGRIGWWDIVPRSLLSDRPHLLISDSTYDRRRHTYVLREIAVFDDGRLDAQQTSGWLCPYDRIPSLFRRGGFEVEAIFDGWTTAHGTPLSESLLVTARRAR